jgi:hypothetical protein
LRRLASAVLLLALLLPAAARAHSRSASYSSFDLQGRGAHITFRISQLELTRLPWGVVAPPALERDLGAYLSGALRLEAGATPCPVVDGPRALEAPPGRAVIEWSVRCPGTGALAIESDLLREVEPGQPVVERVLSRSAPRWELPRATAGRPPPRASGSSFGSYIALGVRHIASGTDHLIFLLGLLLLARRVRDVLTIVTGFTVGHSITLALAALGTVHPEPRAVEALIGLSIALVAAENAWLLSGKSRAVPLFVLAALAGMAGLAADGLGVVPALTLLGLALFSACYFGLLDRVPRPDRLRFAIAFCFGLVHGFGFAGVLTEGGLPRDRMLSALLGFNGGVEIGQLVVVAMAWPLLAGLARWRDGAYHRFAVEAGTGLVCALGVFWLVSRAYG